MKRFIAASSIALITATGGAVAQDADVPTSAEIDTIMQYAPGADLSTLSDAQIDALVAIAYSGDSESDKRQQIGAYFEDSGSMDGETRTVTTVTVDSTDPVTEYERDLITSYAPGADLTTLTDAEVDSLVAYLSSGDATEGDKRQRVQSMFQ